MNPAGAPSTLQRHGAWMLWLGLFVLGLGVASLERWRPEVSYRIWGQAYKVIDMGVNPLRERTSRFLDVLVRIDQLWRTEAQNRDLRRRVSRLSFDNQMLTEQLARLERLSGLGQWKGPAELLLLPADVIGLVIHDLSAQLVINRGSDDGLAAGDPVVALDGLVGVVRSVSSRSARVQGLSDPFSAVGVVTRQGRARGILKGTGRGRPLEFTLEDETQDFNVGELLVSSGLQNSIYPKGVVIGRIVDRGLNPYGLPYGVVEPLVAFDQIEEVLLVVPRERPGARDMTTTSTRLGHLTISMPEPRPLAPATSTPATTGTLVDAGTTATAAATSPTQGLPDGPATPSTPTLAPAPEDRP